MKDTNNKLQISNETGRSAIVGVEPVILAAESRRAEWLEELKDFLRIPSVSAQPQRTGEVRQAAEWLTASLQAAGLRNTRLITTEQHPLVYADWLDAGPEAPTVLIYGHYDVQPAEPLDKWHSPPFEPTVKDDHLYARGVADDKGQLFVHVKAVEAFLETSGRLPVNVKFILEGEEEVGGKSLTAFVSDNREFLAADVALVSDTQMPSPSQPAIVYGFRGNCYVLVDITGPQGDLHSGTYGGGIDNPLNVLGHLIASLKSRDGHILIPGFYDQVRSVNADERQRLVASLADENAWLLRTGAPALWGEPEFALAERIAARPTLDVNGIIGGYTGEGTKTVLPSHAHAKISMRLVPDQSPEEIYRLFSKYVQEIAPSTVKVETRLSHGSEPVIVALDTPAMKAAKWAYQETFGAQPILTREGGSIPVVSRFQQDLGLESVMMGFGLPDDQIHAPNERFYLPNFYRGVETSIRFLGRLATLWAAKQR